VLLLAAGAALLSMRMWPYRVLDMTNIVGGAVVAVCLLLYYLPLDLEKSSKERPAGSESAPADVVPEVAGGAEEPE
jgi:hypothetical protein